MNLYMKQKLFSWGDKFSIYDEAGNPRYYVEGEIFTWGRKLHLYDLSNRELAFIQQEVLTFLPKYYIFRGGQKMAEVVKEFTFFKQEYSVNGLGWKVRGNFFAHEYEIYNSARPLACVSKEWFTLGDAYQISISPQADEVTVLSIVLVIDGCIDNNN
ncbi:MAG: hypothetical protein E7486_04880 [Ruminococcaceae bacterium]|nr:hypothetical protein [Oscillospiraceae bacterium]